ncbi:MAG TPA: hypothetical protein VHZ78_04800 [Rhizomicrobium sp.]|jgi:ElaB/YqjD/DUF883 family membrane-anchored ribosome-binding protein|nr:hypothetical protein [Rhizomicrobium sp.]
MAATTAATGDIDNRLSALRTDMETLQKDLRALAGDVTGAASAQAKDALKKAEAVAERAYDLAEEAAAQASKTAFEAAEDVEEWATENAESLRETVRAQPLTSLAIAVGAGAFLALLLKR